MAHTIGRFELQGVIGEGAMGTVYRAYDPTIGRTVAIKLVKFDRNASQELRDRVLREARSAGSLAHPNVVTIYDVGVEQNLAFIAMEIVDGSSLATQIEASAPFPPAAIVGWLEQIADALDHAHRRGVIHRDVKPSNILLSGDGRIKVVDFGIAKLARTITAEKGMVVGTPGYMAPEQVQGLLVDYRCDIFALGVVAYELLAGKCPFEGDTLVSTIYKVISEPPPPLQEFVAELPDIFNGVLAKALEKSAAARYGSCAELAAAVREAAQVTVVPLVRAAATERAPAAESEERFCRRCGAVLEPTVRFCYRCGAPRVDLSEARTDPPEGFKTRVDPTTTRVSSERGEVTAPMWPETAPIVRSPAAPLDVDTEPLEEPPDTEPLEEANGEPPRRLAAVTLVEDSQPSEVAHPSPRQSPRTSRAAIAFVVALSLLVVGALGVWAVMVYRDRQSAPEQPPVPSPDDGPVARADGGGPSDAPVGAEAPPGRDGGLESVAGSAVLVLRDETANVVDAELASGAPDGRFARIGPGGSLALALPGGRVLRDGGGLEPDVRVVGDPGSSGPYEIYARTPAGRFIRIDRVRVFGSHDMAHHGVVEADAFKIVNTGTADLLIDAIVPLREPEAR